MTEYKLTLIEKIRKFFGLDSNYYNDIHQLHREDGPAYIHLNGYQAWYLTGKLHREDGPAVIYADGSQEWWVNGNLHCEDGPAYIGQDGSQYWYVNGRPITEEVNQWFKDCNLTYETMEFEDKMALKFFIKGLV